MSTSELLEMNIEKPDIQRIANLSKVDDIVKQQLVFFKKNGHFNFTASSPINIHYINESYMLVDGQHRLLALTKLYNEHSHNIQFFVTIVRVDTQAQLEYNYNSINMNTPLPEFGQFQNLDKTIVETVFSEIQVIYPDIWSKTSRARRPQIFANHFQEALAFICCETNITSPIILKQLVLDYDRQLCNWDSTIFFKQCGVSELQYKMAVDQDFYLGLFQHLPQEYRFFWARKIVEAQTGKILKTTTHFKNKKKKIPKKVKNDAWDQHVGNKIAQAQCLCCRLNVINSKDFHAGHIKSERNGGKCTVDNIVPICSACNHSMGSTNMDEYISEHYPANLAKFLNRDYTESNNSWGVAAYFK
jgi:hypothetical protein